MSTDLRIALIGCGAHGGTRLASAVWSTEGVALSACVDVDAAAARRAAHTVAEVLTSVESALFELLEVSGTAEFKQVASLIK